MHLRGVASRVLLAAGGLLLALSVSLLVAAWTLPAQGMEDLARAVGALLLAALAGIPFALALLAGSLKRWHVALAAAGCALALLPAAGLVSAGLDGSAGVAALGFVAALAAVLGLGAAPRRWRSAA